MGSSIHYFSGPCFWAKVYEHNLDSWGDKIYASIEIELDAEQRKALKASGCRAGFKPADDGGIRVKFKRNLEHHIPELGGVPQVLSIDGEPFSELIGNGSKVTVKVCVYDTKMGKGTRLESIRVDELVPYEKSAGSPESIDSKFLVGVPF